MSEEPKVNRAELGPTITIFTYKEEIVAGEERKTLDLFTKEELIEYVRMLVTENRILKGKFEVLKASHFGERYEGKDNWHSMIRDL